MTVEQVEPARGNSRPAVYLVKDGGAVIGMMEKYRNTKTNVHPWKAYLGTGENSTFLGAFYPYHFPDVMDGGRKAAIQAIADARHATSGKVPAGIDFDTP